MWIKSQVPSTWKERRWERKNFEERSHFISEKDGRCFFILKERLCVCLTNGKLSAQKIDSHENSGYLRKDIHLSAEGHPVWRTQRKTTTIVFLPRAPAVTNNKAKSLVQTLMLWLMPETKTEHSNNEGGYNKTLMDKQKAIENLKIKNLSLHKSRKAFSVEHPSIFFFFWLICSLPRVATAN